MADDRPDTPPHSHDQAAHAAQAKGEGDLNVPLIVTIGLISCILLIVIGIGTVAWFRYELRQEQWLKVIERENVELRDLNLEAEARLRNIDEAMGQVARRYREASPEQRGAIRPGVPAEELDEPEAFEVDNGTVPAPDAEPEADIDAEGAEDAEAATEPEVETTDEGEEAEEDEDEDTNAS